MIRKLALALVVGTIALAAITGAADAATARASNTITIYSGPGYGYPAIGKLPRNAVVGLSECTASGRWCLITNNRPNGWVLGSYLVGSAAKVNATPFRPLVNPFFNPHGFDRRHRMVP